MSKLNEDFLNYLYNTNLDEDVTNKSSAELYGVARAGFEGFLYTICMFITHRDMDTNTASNMLYEVESAVKHSEALGVTFDSSLKTAITDAKTALETNKAKLPDSEPGDNFDELW